MPKTKVVEDKIQSVEHFPIKFLTPAGIDVRSDKEGIPQYKYSNAAPDSFTVSEWRDKRFRQQYPGYDVKVFMKDGKVASGNMKLANVRSGK